MTGDPYDPHYFDPAERELLTEEEELLVALFGEWVARRECQDRVDDEADDEQGWDGDQ